MFGAKERSARGRSARRALLLGGVLGVAACQIPPGPAVDPAPFVLTATGDYVLSGAPPGIEVTLGSKQVHPARQAGGPEQAPPQ